MQGVIVEALHVLPPVPLVADQGMLRLRQVTAYLMGPSGQRMNGKQGSPVSTVQCPKSRHSFFSIQPHVYPALVRHLSGNQNEIKLVYLAFLVEFSVSPRK